DHVIDHQDIFAFDVADDVHGLGLGDALAALVNDADFAAENLGIHLGPLDVADVSRDENGVAQVEFEAAHPAGEDGDGVEVIDGDVEKSLHLGGVEIDGHDTVCAGALKQVCEELGRDRNTSGIFSILSGVTKIRNDGSDSLGAGALEHVDPDEQLAVVSIYRMRCRLDNVSRHDGEWAERTL